MFGTLKRENLEGKSITLPILDINEDGIKFSLSLNYNKEFNVQQKLFLKEIRGTNNILFDKPIELLIKWKREEKSKLLIGCEINSFTEESKKKFTELVNSKKVFRRKSFRDKLKKSIRSKINIIYSEKNKRYFYFKYIFILFIGIILIILFFGYFFANKIQQMENKSQNLSMNLYSEKTIKGFFKNDIISSEQKNRISSLKLDIQVFRKFIQIQGGKKF